MERVIAISDDGLNVNILDTRSEEEIIGQDTDFIYNFNAREARDELEHLRRVEQELHLQF